MYTCILTNGVLYFVNLNILRKIGFLKGTGSESGGIIDTVPIAGQVSEQLSKVSDSIKKMSNSDVLEAIKLMGVEFFLSTEWGSKSVSWTSSTIGQKNLDAVDMTKYQMTLISGSEMNRILVNIVGLTALDFLLGSKLSAKRAIRRLICQAPIEYEKSLIGYQCPCPKGKC